MTQQKTRASKRRKTLNEPLMTRLILTVTLVLLILILSSQGWLVTLAVIVVLTVLILVVGGAPELLPGILKVILNGIHRIVQF